MQKQCPYCGEMIDTNLTICPICCEKLPQVQEDKNANTKICPFCKEEIASDSTICPICFEKLSQPLSQNNTQKKKSESKPKTLKKRKQPIITRFFEVFFTKLFQKFVKENKVKNCKNF